MPRSTSSSIEVRGVDELSRAFRRFEGNLGRQLQKELRTAGLIVAEHAKTLAQQKQLHDDRPPPKGGLITNVRVSVRTGAVYVRDTARRPSPKYPTGYNYPARLEYEKGGARSFLRPALEQRQDVVMLAIERMLTKLEHEWEVT